MPTMNAMIGCKGWGSVLEKQLLWCQLLSRTDLDMFSQPFAQFWHLKQVVQGFVEELKAQTMQNSKINKEINNVHVILSSIL